MSIVKRFINVLLIQPVDPYATRPLPEIIYTQAFRTSILEKQARREASLWPSSAASAATTVTTPSEVEKERTPTPPLLADKPQQVTTGRLPIPPAPIIPPYLPGLGAGAVPSTHTSDSSGLMNEEADDDDDEGLFPSAATRARPPPTEQPVASARPPTEQVSTPSAAPRSRVVDDAAVRRIQNELEKRFGGGVAVGGDDDDNKTRSVSQQQESRPRSQTNSRKSQVEQFSGRLSMIDD
jgi:hypothetical protein